MKLESKVHGVLNYKEEDKTFFKKGLLGFENCKEFVIIELEGCYPFKLLHSLEDMNFGIIVVDPFYVMKEYEIKLSKKLIDNLEIKKEEDVMLYTTVTLNQDVEKITTNLSAPLIVNVKSGMGEQIVLGNDKYKIKHLVKQGRR